MSKYDIDYFIAKVEALEEKDFNRGAMKEVINGKECRCMMGHCEAVDWKHTEESLALTKLIDPNIKKEVGQDVDEVVININDDFPNGGIREGWLQKLKSIKDGR